MNSLNEGIIDVPDDLVKYVAERILKFVGNHLGKEFDKKYHDNFKVKNRMIVNSIDHYEVNGGDTLSAATFDIDVSDIKYTDRDVDKLSIGVHLHNHNHMYLPDKNVLAVSVKKLFEIIDRVNVKSENASEQDDYYELIDTFNVINENLDKFHDTIKSSVKHELAHFIQFRYLKDKHSKQAEIASDYDDDDKDAYFSSDIEYSPQIISAIEIFKNNIQYSGDVTAKEYFRYMVGMRDGRRIPLMTDGVQNDETAVRFFSTLKRKNLTKYKKAIKYFVNNI